MKQKVLFSWSGGKDSALALYEIQRDERFEIAALLTTLTQDYNRISMHGVDRILLERQAKSIGIPLEKVFILKNTSIEDYGSKMLNILTHYLRRGVSSIVIGDIFLEDVRRYREDNLSQIGMKGLFPLWKRDTLELANTFIDLGFKAIVTCVDSKFLSRKFVGRLYDTSFLSDLPSRVDPCGENGEFHTFVFEGPIFQDKILFSKGKVVFRDNRFYFCDLIPF